jgi:outer membrane lipoprotein carrier protein
MIKKILCGGFLRGIFLFFFTTSTFAQSASQQLSDLLQNLQTFQANFSQAIQDKAGNTLSQSEGKMALKRPGLFRWETQKPNQQLIVADGNTIWIYDKDLAQITKQKQNTQTNAPGLLLSDSVSNLILRFKIESENNAEFKLTPKAKKDLFQFVELIFDQSQLTQMILHDNLGQITVIKFTNTKTNQALSPSLFRFRAPSNIEVIGE